MKIITLAAALTLLFSQPCLQAQDGSHSVKDYTTKNGAYVQPHRATNPDNTKSNNYSHKGNANPHTRKVGTKSADPQTRKTSVAPWQGDPEIDRALADPARW